MASAMVKSEKPAIPRSLSIFEHWSRDWYLSVLRPSGCLRPDTERTYQSVQSLLGESVQSMFGDSGRLLTDKDGAQRWLPHQLPFALTYKRTVSPHNNQNSNSRS